MSTNEDFTRRLDFTNPDHLRLFATMAPPETHDSVERGWRVLGHELAENHSPSQAREHVALNARIAQVAHTQGRDVTVTDSRQDPPRPADGRTPPGERPLPARRGRGRD